MSSDENPTGLSVEGESRQSARLTLSPIPQDEAVGQPLHGKGKSPEVHPMPSRNANESNGGMSAPELPWGTVKVMSPTVVNVGLRPGEFVAQTLFVEFMNTADKKIQAVIQEPLERLLSKSMARGEDGQFDQLLSALSSVSEHCLPSLLRALFAWYDKQNQQLFLAHKQKAQLLLSKAETVKAGAKAEFRAERDFLLEKQGLAVDFLFCQVLIEVLKQLPLHPGHDDLVNHIVQLAFKHFKFKDQQHLGVTFNNAVILADLFAEVIGCLSHSRFHAVRKKFMAELMDLRSKELTALNISSIVSLLMGLKFFRVKMVPIEEFEIYMSFLHELGNYFLDVKDKDIKHALAGVFVEILLPVAASVKTEVNVPVLKSFVELLYPHALDQATKKKHSLAFFPLLTCLLCISQKQFFLTNWHYFLTMCLSNLKHKDAKMARVALESLFRLLWVYVIRIKCESNTATHSRLQSIVNSLFPKGSRNIIPRDTPLNIFVKIIHFVAQERLDFAFKEVIFDLLSVGRPIRTIYPERMNIGLRALLVIADSLQQRDGPPPMPRTASILPSGNTIRMKRSYLTKPLTSDVARNIGIDVYYGPCRRAFDGILRSLDLQVGRPMMLTVVQNLSKEPDELMGGERKPKVELFRTCIAAIPRMLPDGMSHQDVIELLVRLTVHMDEELKGLACQTLQNLMLDCPEWREDLLHGFLQFIAKEIHDSFPQLLDNSLRMLLQLVCGWRNAMQQTNPPSSRKDSVLIADGLAPSLNGPAVQVSPLLRSESCALVLHCVEGLALVMLCQGRSKPRQLAVSILKEVKQLLPLLCTDEGYERPAIDVLDSACEYVLDRYVVHVSAAEKANWIASGVVDFQWMTDKIPTLETDFSLVNSEVGNEYLQWDPWAAALSGFLESRFVLTQCQTAIAYAWPAAHMRISAVYSYVDPNNPQNDTRASLLRSSKSKASTNLGETLNYSNYLSLWQKYLVFACAVAPPALQSVPAVMRCASPETLQSSVEGNEGLSRSNELRIPRVANVSASNLFKLVVPLLRCEMTDMRDSVVLGLGSVNPNSLDCLMDELAPYFREAAERKQENLRRKRRRDLLRLQLIRLLEVAVFRGTFNISNVVDHDRCQLKQVYVDLIENARLYCDTDRSDHDRDLPVLTSLRLHFAKLVVLLIQSFSVDKRTHLLPVDLRTHLFNLFSPWCGKQLGGNGDRRHSKERDTMSSLEYFSVAAMAGVLCCGPVFDAKAISEDGYLYKNWLEPLLNSRNERLELLTDESLTLLLEYNADIGAFLDWLVDKCYTAPGKVADKCFKSVATVFSNREYPCDIGAILNLTILYCGYPVRETQQLAVELLQILDERFFGEETLRRAAAPHSDETSSGGVNIREGELGAAELLDSSFSKSQLFLSQQLAQLHPEMTMPMFSEISYRMQRARPARQVSLLQYLLPWMWNVELVDGSVDMGIRTGTISLNAKMAESQALARRPLKGDGWGSRQASEMVLNNLLHLTVKFGNEHAKLLESLWAGLVTYWPSNLRIILRYLGVMSTLAQSTILPFAKRIVIYLARVHSERLVDELMIELQTIDVFRCPLERTEMAPYYRWIRRENLSESQEDETVEKRRSGLIHTKRHTPCEELMSAAMNNEDLYTSGAEESNLVPSASMASLVTLKADVINARFASQQVITERDDDTLPKTKEISHSFQLPMPAYGGYYCPLVDFLPDSSQPILMLHRSNLALLFLTDLVLADVEIEWTVHLPLMLHVAVLGLDNSRVLIHDHCKQLLINLIVTHCSGIIPAREVAKLLIAHNLGSQMSLASSRNTASDSGASGTDGRGTVNSYASFLMTASENSSTFGSGIITQQVLPADVILQKDAYSMRFDSVNDLAMAITDFLGAKRGSPLWTFEDITARYWRITSATQLSCFVTHLSRLMNELLPSARIETRWAQTALHAALSCPNRHYAGRSFQIFRALHVPLTSRMLSDVLSRLVETVSEQGEDMQGYVTEIMLTLDAAVLHIELSEHASVSSTPEGFLGRNLAASVNMGPPMNQIHGENSLSPSHTRSTSYSVAMIKKVSPLSERKDQRTFSGGEPGVASYPFGGPVNLPRSKSAQTLKMLNENGNIDEHVVTLSQLLWIAISMLESDYEHEFLLALKLLEKLLDLSAQERRECLERLNRMVKQLKWTNFPGIQSLILKGCTFATTFDFSLQHLSKIITFLDSPMIDPSQSSGFALNVISLLPYLVLHYEDPTKLCLTAAENIAERCAAELDRMGGPQPGSSGTLSDHSLEHLATVMRLYSRKAFNREGFQWTKCVVKYLHDAFSSITNQLLALLTEILEKGPIHIHQPVLQVMYCLFNHTDLTNSSASISINADFLRTVSKHIQSPNWKEAAKILKLAVTRSSSLTAPPISLAPFDPEADPSSRKELPGRTMEFFMDLTGMGLSQTDSGSGQNPDGSPKKTQQPTDSLRKLHLCQMKVREHLVNLLNASGLRVGLPKSPSEASINKVIFSQSSHELGGEPPSSVYSSSGELTIGPDNRSATPSPETQIANLDDDSTFNPVFKEFDFLEEEQDNTSESAESAFTCNWTTLTLQRTKSVSSKAEADEGGPSLSAKFASSPSLVNPPSDSESSEDEESNNSLIEEETPETLSAQDMERLFVSQSQNSSDNRAPTPASLTISQSSRPELNTPLPPLLALECCHHATGQIEEIWANHTAAVAVDTDGSVLAGTTQLFVQLYRESCGKVCSLLRDSCHFLSMCPAFATVTAAFTRALDVLMRVNDCDFIFVTPQTLMLCGFIQRLKFAVLELKEHYETFLERKELTIRCLNAVKSSMRLQRMGERLEEHSTQEQEVELTRSLYKVYFQLLLLHEGFTKLVDSLSSAVARQETVFDMSCEVQTLQRQLLCAISDLLSGNDNLLSPTEAGAVGGNPVSILAHLLQNGEFRQAIIQLRLFRSQNVNRMDFGCCEEEDVEVLLSLYCRSLGESGATASYFVMVPSDPPAMEASNSLMEINLSLSGIIRSLGGSLRHHMSAAQLDSAEVVEV